MNAIFLAVMENILRLYRLEYDREVLACVKERERKNIKVEWKLDITQARRKLNKHYVKVNEGNLKFKAT